MTPVRIILQYDGDGTFISGATVNVELYKAPPHTPSSPIPVPENPSGSGIYIVDLAEGTDIIVRASFNNRHQINGYPLLDVYSEVLTRPNPSYVTFPVQNKYSLEMMRETILYLSNKDNYDGTNRMYRLRQATKHLDRIKKSYSNEIFYKEPLFKSLRQLEKEVNYGKLELHIQQYYKKSLLQEIESNPKLKRKLLNNPNLFRFYEVNPKKLRKDYNIRLKNFRRPTKLVFPLTDLSLVPVVQLGNLHLGNSNLTRPVIQPGDLTRPR